VTSFAHPRIRAVVLSALAFAATLVGTTTSAQGAAAQGAAAQGSAPVDTATVVALEDALATIEGRVGVVTAGLDLAEAERALARTESDPLALRLEHTQARQAVDAARAALAAARFEARAEVAAAWARVRETALQVTLAEAARDLSERALAVAELRLERGSATQLDVDEARTDLADAEANLAAARDGLALAQADLTGLTGLPRADELPPIERERLAAPLPDDAELDAAIDALPAYLQVAHGVELARLGVELLDPSFAAQAQIDAAATQLAQAEAGASEARRGLRLQVQALRNAAVSARERERLAREAQGQALERESIEESRYEAGLISELALAGVRLERQQADLVAVQAEHQLMNALLDLQAGTLRPLDGWDGR
jgi:outer membrane protein TolC